MTADERHPEWIVDPHTPNIARMYDYYLGGKDHFAADRAAAERVLQAIPYAPEFARSNRRFLSRAVTHLAALGIRQFVDIGSGLPSQENTHEVAQRAAPDARVVYVDRDPVVLAHARALLARDDNTTVIQADLREPDRILGHPELTAQIDFSRPVAILLLAILHFLPDDENPAAVVETLRSHLAPGSFLVLSHVHAGEVPDDLQREVRGAYGKTAAGDIIPRTPAEIGAFFTRTKLHQPGLVPVESWNPEAAPYVPRLTKAGLLGAIGEVV
ncbi:SAM-dependent methyltransferase [Actinomadura atramentaria]|uniref:SAM-dependent methyltransferase n=1 Tax=Actinomadura atramentaria TaxID=1990 RepID=UPI0003642F8E|nr:SAM-dependent methyltransferase [Actinomadura atramentaria]